MKHLVLKTLGQAKRLVLVIIGFTVLAMGVAMIVLPGPAVVVIPVGLAILATEFIWARKLLGTVKERFQRMRKWNPYAHESESTWHVTHEEDYFTMKTQPPHKPFSLIREFQLADWFTLANAVCGTGALFSMLTYLQLNDVRHVYFACGLVFAAFVFDVLDGRIARWRQKSSIMGRELDSLADVISFGVAPAVIGYGCGMQGLYDRIVLTCFVACGVSRLARYNVTADALSEGGGKVKYFEGTPIPTSLLLVVVLFWAASQGAVRDSLWFGQVMFAGFTLHPLVLLFAVSGSLMVRRIRIPKL